MSKDKKDQVIEMLTDVLKKVAEESYNRADFSTNAMIMDVLAIVEGYDE